MSSCKKGYVRDGGRCRRSRKSVNWRSYVEDDIFAKQLVGDMIKKGVNPEEALEVYVNSVDGDASQLPTKLEKYARNKGWLEG